MIWFTGDINLTDWIFNIGFGIGTKISKGLDPFKYLNRRQEDLWIGNFEGVASNVSNNKGLYSMAFRVKPETLASLHHLDYYGFANNHAMEHGPNAYRETVSALNSYGSKVFGTKEHKSVIFEHQGKTVSVTGMCLRIEATNEEPLYWHNPEFQEIMDEINSLPIEAYKIFFVHWGNEYINRPSSFQKKIAHWLIDSGVNLIIGMHPHVLQGYEDYHGGRVYYSLGNCVFDMPSKQCQIGALVGVDLTNGEPIFNEKYIMIDEECCPHLVEENSISTIWHFDFLNKCLQKEDNSEEYHQEIKKGYLAYRKANWKRILSYVIFHPVFFCKITKDFLKRKIKK